MIKVGTGPRVCVGDVEAAAQEYMEGPDPWQYINTSIHQYIRYIKVDGETDRI